MTTKKTRVEKPQPQEGAPAVEAKRDPRLCTCTDVQRRYDGDGLVVQLNGVNHYRCSVCGKLYA